MATTINKLDEKVKPQVHHKKPIPNCLSKEGENQLKFKPKYTQPKLISKYKKYTPNPFVSKEKQKMNKTMITPIDNYNKQTEILNSTNNKNYFKLISVSRRENSWDKSNTDISLNESKISNVSNILQKSHIKNKISLNYGMPNISKASISYLNMNDIGYNKYLREESLRDNIISEVRKTSPCFLTEKKEKKKSKPIGLKSKLMIDSCIKPKVLLQLQIQKKEINRSNNSSRIGHKKHTNPLKQITLCNRSNANCNSEKKKKENTTTSFDSLITKETSSKIKIVEGQAISVEKKERIRKVIKCIHDLSKTGLTGKEKKINQDSYFIFKNFLGQLDYIFMGVCDGHGLFGHEVSGYIRENLPMDLNHSMREKKVNIVTDDLNNIITQTFIHENYYLRKNTLIDTKLSGTTCASVLYCPEKMIIANLGDSRVILGREVNGEWKHENLSRDHKPSERDEAERILKIGGRIRPMIDDEGSFVGPLRVYMKEKDVPGLSMTRSFGDYYAATAGCISLPEVTEYYFQQGDRFMVIATDGLWEFISSDEVVNIVQKYYLSEDIVGCCEDLYRESCKRWIDEEEVIDDITMIIVFFQS